MEETFPVGATLQNSQLKQWGRWLFFFGLLYLFLIAIQLFGTGIKMMGADAAHELFSGLANPFAGLAVGILCTVLVQSSSVTTSIIVGIVGAGEISVATAVPMIMGANIGTSITNTIVSLGSIGRNEEFRRAFAGATVHDFFNILTVALLLPIELATGILARCAAWLTVLMPVGSGGKFKSPIKVAVKAGAKKFQYFLDSVVGLDGIWLSLGLGTVALILIIVTLTLITKNMRALMADRIERMINQVLLKSGLLGIFIGVVITIAVQSSSITTSLLVPMFAAGVISLQAGFPIMLGANIGTTVTALLASLVTGSAGLTIAIVHLLFNLVGVGLFFPFKRAREVPIYFSEKLADLAIKNRLWVIMYILVIFILVPTIGIVLWK